MASAVTRREGAEEDEEEEKDEDEEEKRGSLERGLRQGRRMDPDPLAQQRTHEENAELPNVGRGSTVALEVCQVSPASRPPTLCPAPPHSPARPRPPERRPRDGRTQAAAPVVSWITPVHNGAAFLDEMLASLLAQTVTPADVPMELSLVDDASTDGTWALVTAWAPKFAERGWTVTVSRNAAGVPRGCGWGCNAAIAQARGRYLCFADADDVSHPDRLRAQLDAMRRAEAMAEVDDDDRSLVGANFERTPPGSTARYTAWLNRLTTPADLMAHRFVEVTLIKPTWFLRRSRWAALGGFDERGRGTPEDMLFFYAHLDRGGRLLKAGASSDDALGVVTDPPDAAASPAPLEPPPPPPLLIYRYHPGATSAAVLEATLLEVRLRALERQVLVHWDRFTIWNAGKAGRRVYAALAPEHRRKVAAFCDVDVRKLAVGVYYRQGMERAIPVVPYTAAVPPLLLCVKLDLTGGQFEANLASLRLRSGIDFFYFC